MVPPAEYYMGWVIQPLNWEGNAFYLYPRLDDTGKSGFNLIGSRFAAIAFIERRVKYN